MPRQETLTLRERYVVFTAFRSRFSARCSGVSIRMSAMTASTPWLARKIQRDQIIDVCRRMYANGWISATDGNASVRVNDQIIATPSGVHKGQMTRDQLVVVDMDGRPIGGASSPRFAQRTHGTAQDITSSDEDKPLRASSELAMHLTVYANRPDVRAVLHAHPPCCVALSLAGVRLEPCPLPEIVLTVGAIPTLSYATPTTKDLADGVAAPIRSHNAVILSHHGTLTVGADLLEAYYLLERIEHVAQILSRARCMGPVEPLAEAELARLRRIADGKQAT